MKSKEEIQKDIEETIRTMMEEKVKSPDIIIRMQSIQYQQSTLEVFIDIRDILHSMMMDARGI